MADTPSALPAAARVKLEALQNAGNPPVTPPAADAPLTPPTDNTPPAPPAADTPPTPPTVERITLTREELNELRAAAGASKTMEARLEEAESRNQALTLRLTELEESHKGNSTAPPASAPPAATGPAAKLEAATFSDEETERYGDSKEYIAKVARNVIAELLPPILANLEGGLNEVRTTATNTTKTLEQQQHERFANKLQEAAPNYRELVRHQHWGKFIDEVDDLSGNTMESLLAYHINKKDAIQAAKIYKRFEDKYVKPLAPTDNAEYAGALPGTGASTPPADPGAPKPKLKLSDRTKASKDFINKKITYEELQLVNKSFEEAEKAGNVDYNS